MGTVDSIILAAVVAVLVVAIRRFVGTATGTRDCCSGAKRQGAKKFKNVKIADTDKSHYPYAADFSVKGMSCENCVDNVTRALDSVDGTWATVSLEQGRARVLSKKPIDADAYRRAVSEAGYRLV
jgi:copper chaperone CopZ